MPRVSECRTKEPVISLLQWKQAESRKAPFPAGLCYASANILDNVIEQDHRTVKKRVWLAKGYGSFRRLADDTGN